MTDKERTEVSNAHSPDVAILPRGVGEVLQNILLQRANQHAQQPVRRPRRKRRLFSPRIGSQGRTAHAEMLENMRSVVNATFVTNRSGAFRVSGFVLANPRMKLTRAFSYLRLTRPQCANSKRRPLNVNGNSRKSRDCQTPKCRSRCHRHKRALVVPYTMQPAVANLKRKKHSARPQYTMKFLKRAVLLLPRTQVVQHQHGHDRR